MTAKEKSRTTEVPGDGEVLLVRKPKGLTSFDVVRAIRRSKSVKKAGHAGTLDPLATGLLIVATGKQTKNLDRYQKLEKEYLCCMRLGERTESLDAETPVIEKKPWDHVTSEQVERVVERFAGRQVQLPPMYSAVKVNGQPLYRYARKGVSVARRPREVFVRSLSVQSFEPPDVRLRIVCSSGTYVRSLVDDIGNELGCGAHVTELERTRIGDFRLNDALTLDDLRSGKTSERVKG